MLLAAVNGALIPPIARAMLWASVGSFASVMGLWPKQSRVFLFLGVIPLLAGRETLMEVVAAAPVLVTATALVIIGLGAAVWRAGIRPPELLPRWFRAYGVVLVLILAAVGSIILLRG